MAAMNPNNLGADAMGLRWAYTDSLKYVWYSSLPFGLLCIIWCIVMEKNGKFITNRVAAVSEDELCSIDDWLNIIRLCIKIFPNRG